MRQYSDRGGLVSGRIVVGVDGSEGSKLALAWALDEAKLRRAALVAVHAWMQPYPSAAGVAGTFVVPVDPSTVEAARNAAEGLLESLVSEANTDGVEVERLLVEGPAAEALVETAKRAELLVVGSRGHGGFTGLLLGSVSQQCAHHAPCPVVIIRPQSEDD
jgi:nucleotide-binding universal stress UspA family protein